MSLPRVIASSTTLSRKILLSPTCVTSGINIPISRLPYFTSYVRSVSLSHNLLGPGADHKYRSQEEKDEKLKSENKKKKVLMMGLAVGGVAGGLLGYYNYKKKQAQSMTSIANDSLDKEYLLESPPPYFPPIRTISNPGSSKDMKITLYQYQTCPFCCKARVFLDYFGFNYDVVEVNSVMRTQVKWSKYKKVPIVVVQNGDKVIQVNDSSVIVSALYSLLVDAAETKLEQVMDCYPTIRFMDDGVEKSEIQNKYFLMFNETKVARTKEDIVEERRWRKWVDDELVHSLSPNVYRTPSEALAAFQWFDEVGRWSEVFSVWERYLVIYFGASVMWLLGKRLKKRHNLKDNVRQSLYDQCNHWMKSLSKKGTPFMGGSQPNLSDLAVFGVLTAVEGCEAFSDARRETKIGGWFDRMKEVVNSREGRHLLA